MPSFTPFYGNDMEKAKKSTNKGSFTSETAKKANKKSRESARRNRSMREWAKFYGKQHITLRMPDKTEADATWDGAVVVGMYQAAMAGDSKAATMIAKLTGQNIDETINVNARVKNEKELTPEEAAEFMAELKKRI